ncbi:MAG: hypothetical protein ABF263_05280 [Polaribacter sp.]
MNRFRDLILNKKLINQFVTLQSEGNYAIITVKNGKVNAISHEVIEGLNTSLDKVEREHKVGKQV